MVLALIPIFDQYIYPNIKMSPLFRIGVGMIISACAFVMSAIVEAVISSSDEHSVSVFLQLPQIFVLSVSEILVSITGLEFAYANAPESMKSTVMALFLLTTAVGDLLGGGLYATLGENISPAALFLLCAVAMVFNTFLFSRVASKFIPLSSSISSSSIGDGGSSNGISMAKNDQTRRRYNSIENEKDDKDLGSSSSRISVFGIGDDNDDEEVEL
jgi:dipeptide/tripeptide permease